MYNDFSDCSDPMAVSDSCQTAYRPALFETRHLDWVLKHTAEVKFTDAGLAHAPPAEILPPDRPRRDVLNEQLALEARPLVG